jgi:hypothetical protein
MKDQHSNEPAERRFLAINFWLGSRDKGYQIGPALVSTSDYEIFHFWDETLAAALGPNDYEIMKLYPRGITLEEASKQFTKDFAFAVVSNRRAANWMSSIDISNSLNPITNTEPLYVMTA